MKRITKLSSMLFFLLLTAWTQMFAADRKEGTATGSGAEFFRQNLALKYSDLQNGQRILIKSANTAESNGRWVSFVKASNNHFSTASLSNVNVFVIEETTQVGNKFTFLLKRESDDAYLTSNGKTTQDKSMAVPLQAVDPSSNFSSSDTYYPTWDTPNENQYTYLVRLVQANSTGNFFNISNANLFTTGNGSWSAYYIFNAADYPFVYSQEPENGVFSENTVWYYLTLRNKYLTYDSNNENQVTVTSTANPVTYGSFWTFVKTENGIKIYNAATGNKILSSANASNGTKPSMQEETTSTNSTWNYTIDSNDASALYFNLSNNASSWLNDYSNGAGYVGFYNGSNDDGSKLRISYIGEISDLISTTKESQQAITGAVGTLISSDYQEFVNDLNKKTIEGLVEALKIRDLKTDNKVIFNVQQPYYLYAYASASANKYMKIGNDKILVGTNISNDNASIIWKFNGDDATGFKIVGQGYYLGQRTQDSQAIPVVSEDEAALYKKISVSGKTAAFYLRPDNAKGLHIDAQGNVVSWNSGGGSEWYLIPATSIETEITDAGYATVNYPFAVQLPQDRGIKAYTGKAINSTTFELTEVPEGKIPANTPVVLSGAQDTYTLTIDTENTDNPINSQLSGTLLPETIGTETTVYGLAKGDHGVGFYRMNSTDDRTIGANKAYLNAEDLSTVSQGVRGLVFSFNDNDGTTTGIESVAPEVANEEYYDLQGRRVMNPSKGIYVTKSGKKVLFTK